jgi:hypothetical protein
MREMNALDWSLKLDLEKLVKEGAVIVCVVPLSIRDDGWVREYRIIYQRK